MSPYAWGTQILPILVIMRHGSGRNPLQATLAQCPFVRMHTRRQQGGQPHWTMRLPACTGPLLDAGDRWSWRSVAPAGEEERAADSKLDRLADELRALGIQF